MVNLAQLMYAIHENQNAILKKSEDLEFIGHCLINVNDTLAQCYQDIFVLHQTNYKRDGYFVEFGATNGLEISNTVLLEKKYDWKGILAEPNPVYHEGLFKNRACNISKNCVYSVTGKQVEFLASDASDISGIKEFALKDEHTEARKKGQTILVPTISLVDLLEYYDAPKQIDFLSIDTEGSEYHILEAFFSNSKNYVIDLITVEHNYVSDQREKIFSLLSKNGYVRKFVALSRWDDFYMRTK